MQLFKRSVSARGLTAFGFEILLVAGSLLVAALLYGPANDPGFLWRIVLPTGLVLVCLYYNDFYDLTIVHSEREVVIRLFQAGGVASILLALIYFVLPAVAVHYRTFFPSLFLLARDDSGLAVRVQPPDPHSEAGREHPHRRDRSGRSGGRPSDRRAGRFCLSDRRIRGGRFGRDGHA